MVYLVWRVAIARMASLSRVYRTSARLRTTTEDSERHPKLAVSRSLDAWPEPRVCSVIAPVKPPCRMTGERLSSDSVHSMSR